METYNGLRCKTANRILFIATVLSIGIQYLLVFLGVRQTPVLLLGTQLSVLLTGLLGVVILLITSDRCPQGIASSANIPENLCFYVFNHYLCLSDHFNVEFNFNVFCGQCCGGNGCGHL